MILQHRLLEEDDMNHVKGQQNANTATTDNLEHRSCGLDILNMMGFDKNDIETLTFENLKNRNPVNTS
jgi:hypothetical protein